MNAKKAILDFDMLTLHYLLPQLGMHKVFVPKKQMKYRMLHSSRIYSKLKGKVQQNNYNFTFPENGTLILYPTYHDQSAIKMVYPHVDKGNDVIEGYNYLISGYGHFLVEDVQCKETKKILFETVNFSTYFQFAIIRTSRKCVGDLDKPTSKSNKIDTFLKESNCSASKYIIQFLQDTVNTDWDMKD